MYKKPYSTGETTRITGISRWRLHNWDRHGHFTPSIARATGSGSNRYYSYIDLIGLLAVRTLVDEYSIQVRKLGEIQRGIKAFEGKLQNAHLLVAEKEPVIDVLVLSGRQYQALMRVSGILPFRYHFALGELFEQIKLNIKANRRGLHCQCAGEAPLAPEMER